ncbi:hypothetical protein AVDCRST_MAG81-3204 [uncultured Synechococcales cyanobacterium]|uniref:Uncharacterized protein n=1 Tax=uncultured Synechococcales cyanobacterium TaxID=1936017 RepID=A0A6J4VKW4_9CYAN|nr:hypothetical protein AVDCRST_MAG81-3204 [uncultured Synechococcales cyanobacterium]
MTCYGVSMVVTTATQRGVKRLLLITTLARSLEDRVTSTAAKITFERGWRDLKVSWVDP